MADDRFFWSRLRWRLHGAWMWPAFLVLTVVDALLLWQLPPIRTGVDPIPALLLAGFGNLVIVGALGPWLARRISRRQDPPPTAAEHEVRKDRAGTALLLAGVFGVLASGFAARPTVVTETESTQANARAVQRFVTDSRDAELLRNIETANTIRLGEDYFRTCIARDDRRRYVCVFVDTGKSPPEVVRDPSQEPNSAFRTP